jgi:hypothetical protein
MRWWAGLGFVLVAGLAAAAEPQPSPNDVEIARAHFNTGQAYYQNGRYADAAREFEEAYRLSRRPALLYNMGKSYDGGNDYARALDAYQRFLAAGPVAAADREFATKRIELLQKMVGKIELAGAVEGSAVTLDGASVGTTPLSAPLVVNPGRHQLTLGHEGYATFRTAVNAPVGGTVTVNAQQTESVRVVTVTRADKEVPVYKRWWLWTAVGGAVVAAGVVTAVVLTTSANDNSGLPTVQLPAVR